MNQYLSKYSPAEEIPLFDRTWPNKKIKKAPIWCSQDLRDGNQALPIPMSLTEKTHFFNLILKMGFKQIEVGFPAASKIEYEFVRNLIETNSIPPDVTIQVLSQIKEEQIKLSFEAIRGLKNATIAIYLSTNPVQREIVLKRDKDQIIATAIQGVRWVKKYSTEYDIPVSLLFAHEGFTATEIEFSLLLSNILIQEWNYFNKKKIILVYPSSLELSMPNIYADRIEWLNNNLTDRDKVTLGVHCHNDRGCAVAASELSMLAGADQVDGTLFGNGERAGNADLITLALNLYSQGVDPLLDLSDLQSIRKLVEECTKLPVHPRHPYGGDLSFLAFSGSHQDAILKVMKERAEKGKQDSRWEVPYLVIDPFDIGRGKEQIIKMSSQSGKAGVTYAVEKALGFELPKEILVDFQKKLQRAAEEKGIEFTNEEIVKEFDGFYGVRNGVWEMVGWNSEESVARVKMEGEDVVSLGVCMEKSSVSVGKLGEVQFEVLVDPFGRNKAYQNYVKFVKINLDSQEESYFGVGKAGDETTAVLKGVVVAMSNSGIKIK